MKISTNTGFSPDLSTLAQAIPLIRNAGFDCFDLSLFGMKSDDDEFNRVADFFDDELFGEIDYDGDGEDGE